MVIPEYGETAFPNFSAVLVPSPDIRKIEILLRQAGSSIRLASVRVMLNHQSVATFVSLNPLPRGVRAVLDVGQTLNPAFHLRSEGENHLTFEALDQGGTSYHGQFFLLVDRQVATPQLSPLARQVLRDEVTAAPVYDAPAIVVGPDVPERISGKVLDLNAEITDRYGLRRVVLEINGKDVEEIVFQNGRPARKRGGFRVNKQLPGEVSGDGLRLSIAIPIELKKTVNTISLRAENVMGMRAQEGKTILRPDD